MNSQDIFLKQLKDTVAKVEPSAKVFLYGSRARGNAKIYSDWDLLILLNKNKITIEDERKITFPLYDLEFETGEIISPVIYAESEWNSKYSITSFYKNISKEGKEI